MFQQRLKGLRELLSKSKLDALLISSSSNIFYLTGFSAFDFIDREGYLLVTKSKNYIITSPLHAEAVEKNIKDMGLITLDQSLSLVSRLKELSTKLPLKRVGFEEENLTVSEFAKFKKAFRLLSSKNLVEHLRIIKDEAEIEKIKKACEIGDLAFKFIQTKIKENVSEEQLMFELEFFIKGKGAKTSFEPLVAFGPNSSIPHHRSDKSKLTKNQIVLLDFGVKYEGYCSDMSRTLFFGKANDKFKRIYKAVLDSQTKAIEFINGKSSMVNSKLSDIDKVARDHIISAGFPPIPHSLGHQIGIDVHEEPRLSPKSNGKAENGMVFSVEPGIYIPGFGGVRVEDLVLYQKGAKFLTSSNRELIEL